MSVRRPSRFGRFVKWFIIPVVLAALGVFVVGPMLGRVGLPIAEKLKPKPKKTVIEQESDADEPKFGEPEVEVSVSPSSSRHRPASTHRPRRKRRERTHPAVPTDQTEAPVVAGGPRADG